MSNTEPKWTPGPYRVQHKTNVMAGRNDCIATCGGRGASNEPDSTRIYNENEANAILFAAAPLLVAALEADDAFFNHFAECGGCCSDERSSYYCGEGDRLFETADRLRSEALAAVRGGGEKGERTTT